MKPTLPTRPHNIPAPPKGYVYLGEGCDLKTPDNFSRNRTDYAYFHKGSSEWVKVSDMYFSNGRNHFIAAKPDTLLYNLNVPKTSTPAPAMPHEVKTLKYETVCVQNGLVAAKITEQSHRNMNFGVGSEDFGKLASSDAPENGMDGRRNRFFVRGLAEGLDSELMLFTAAQFAEFEKEVAAYNKHFSKPAILKTVFFKYDGGSIRGYRKVQVVKEDSAYIEGYDCDKGEYRRYRKDRIEGKIDEIKT